MRWLKRERWKAGIALAGMLLLLVLMVWVPVSAAGAYEGASGLATPGTVQVTPTVDPTMTALQKEQLTLQNKQLQNQYNWPNWFFNNLTAVIAGLVAFFGISQWAVNRRDELRKEAEAQDKELKDRAEERFKTAVAALGDENEGTQVGGAILLRSFLNKEDKEIYERYYTQIFDLAVAYLRPRRTDRTDRTYPRKDPLRQALIVVFKEAFPLARDKLLKEQGTQFDPQSLDASHIQLDHASFRGADLKQIWMPFASLQKAVLYRADLSGARLKWADLSGVKLEEALSLKGTDLREVKGLTEEQLEDFKAKGARIDEDTTTSPPQAPVSPPLPSQSADMQAPSAPPAQASTPTPDTSGSSAPSSQQGPGP